MTAAADSVWIVGCGDIGMRLARVLAAQDLAVTGWIRSASSAAKLSDAGIVPRVVNLDAPMSFLREAPRWLFWFAPPATEGFIELRLRHFLAALKIAPQRLIYLSTSAVYGDCAGRWIDETTPLAPQNDRGLRRLDGERASREFGERSGCEILILRVPGIYGPGRLPVERLQQRTPILRAEDSPYTNRIHADDLAAAAAIVAERGEAGLAYHVSDGNPTTMGDYFLRCAEWLRLPPPLQVDLAEARRTLSPAMMSFLEESKRLDTDRLRALGWRPRYANLSEGLPACL